MPAPSTPHPEALNITCPFCGLVCDDLTAALGDRLEVRANGCPIAGPAFARVATAGESAPRLAGRPATLEAAARAAADLLRSARAPVIAGLGTDVAGARAAGRLADRCGGILDHMNAAAMLRNVMVMQDSGWITTTLSEVRNRADLLIVVGGDLVSRFPRFFERCIANEDTLFGGGRRCEVIFLGVAVPAGLRLPGRVRSIGCEVSRLGEALALLRALVAGRPVSSDGAAGVPLATWQALAERMRSARYGVVAWAAADFDFPHAELTLQALCELTRDLNRETRFAGLPLGGSDGDITSDSVHLWQTGFGSRTSFGTGVPSQDLHRNGTAGLLERGETDLLLWISSFNEERIPPEAAVPLIVLGRPGMRLAEPPAVFIPVGTPGVDHAGHLFRTDRVVALPLRQLRTSALPSVAQAIEAIEAALGEG
jgi:formylmethanofuran dehydrogenase subunit B